MWQLCKRSIAQNALERFFTCMPSFVQFQSSAVRERLPAYFASVRLLAAVNTLMNCKLRSLRKPGTTVSTTVWFVLSVSSHMLRQMAFQFFVAHLTVKSSDVGMVTIQMFFQSITPEEGFPADVADEVADF